VAYFKVPFQHKNYENYLNTAKNMMIMMSVEERWINIRWSYTIHRINANVHVDSVTDS